MLPLSQLLLTINMEYLLVELFIHEFTDALRNITGVGGANTDVSNLLGLGGVLRHQRIEFCQDMS